MGFLNRMSRFFHREHEPNLTTTAALVVSEALSKVEEGIDLINENMPLLAGERLSLYVDRDYRPARITLTDWGQTQPVTIYGALDD